MKRTLILFLFLIVSSSSIFAQKYNDIKFKIANYDNDTLLLAYFYGDKQLIKDTIYAKKKGEFEYKADSLMDEGVYIALFYPKKDYIQFLVNNNESKFTLNLDYNDISKVKPKGSDDNKLFFEYLDYISEKNNLAMSLNQKKDSLTKNNLDIGDIDTKLEDLDNEVNAYQIKLIDENPKSLTSLLIKANRDIKVPEFTGTQDEINKQKYLYYKKHYFDNIDFNNDATLFTPFIYNKVDNYIKNLTPPIPDSINQSIDYILGLMKPQSDIWQYFVSSFLNKYARSMYVGMDAVYVHIVEKYYASGMTPWVDEDKLIQIIDSALKMKNVLIGNKAPNLVLYKDDGTPVDLYSINSDYIVLEFWKPDCGHCKAAMPDIIKFQEDFRDKGVKVISVCTKMGDKISECWDKVKELNMENLFLNLGDEKNQSNFHSVYNVQTTPTIFVLDKNKEILIKNIPADKLGEIMLELMKEQEEKNNSSE
ncbi:MAG: DUF5106 domain-containing protein [Saprospiraceae bacterium]